MKSRSGWRKDAAPAGDGGPNGSLEALREELARSREREADLDATRRAMLYLMEDLNESSAAVLKAKNEWEATFDSISDPLFIHDGDMRIIRCNAAYMEASGMEFDEIIGRPYYEVLPRLPGPLKECLGALESGRPTKETVDFNVPGSDRVYSLKFYPVMNVQGHTRCSIHILEDVTAERKAEAQARVEAEVTKNLLAIAEATATTRDMDVLLGGVVKRVREMMGADICLAHILDPEDGVLRPSTSDGVPSRHVQGFRSKTLDAKDPVIRKVMKAGPGVLGKKMLATLSSSGLLGWVDDLRGAAVIPLIDMDGPMGLILCLYTGDNCNAEGMGDREMSLLAGIAHQVSVALTDARLFKETVDKTMRLAHKVETINTMNEIDRAILSTLDAPEILETAVRMIGTLMGSDRATIALVDPERRGLVYAAGFGLGSLKKGALVPFGKTSATEVLKTLRPQYAPNLADEGGQPALEAALLKEGFLSHIRVPIVVKGEAMGVLNVGSKRPAAFTPDDLSVVEAVSSQIGVALENSRLVADLEELFLGTVRSLSDAIDAKSPWTRGHSERVTEYALEIGRKMGLGDPELKDLELAGLLHDIGKLGTYEQILDKPGRLTEAEVKIIRQHPVKGEEILKHIKQLSHILPAIRHHHECFDGSGYPDGLKGREIPRMARILSVADTADAMGADRPYRPGRPMPAIVAELKRCSGTQFDPRVVKAFISNFAQGY